MAIGIQNSDGVDFDSLFEQRITGDPTAPTTGLQTSAGSDIANRYVPLSFSGSQTPNLTYVQAADGTDCKYIFAALGTVVRWPDPPFWSGKAYSDVAVPPNTARVALRVGSTGQVDFLERTLVVDGGNPLPPDVSPSDVEVRCSQISGDVAISNSWQQGSNFIWLPLGGGGVVGSVQFQRSVFGTAQGLFNLEFREKSNPERGTQGQFTFYLNVG